MTFGPKQLSSAGLRYLVNAEGGFQYYRTVTLPDGTKAKRWVPYNDSKGYCTIGHGQLIAYRRCTTKLVLGWTKKKFGVATPWITNAQAEQVLAQAAQSRVNTVNRLVKAPLTQRQFDALVDLVYNSGLGHKAFRDRKGRFHKKTLGLTTCGILAAVNGRDYRLAGRRILACIKPRDRIHSPGLITRRRHEAAPFLYPCATPTPTPPPGQPPGGSGPWGIQLSMRGLFATTDDGTTWGWGSVTATSAGQPPQTTSFGSDSQGGASFGPYPAGSAVTLDAKPGDNRSLFDHWDGACTGTSNVCTLKEQSKGNYHVTAYFRPHVVTVTVHNTQPSAGLVKGIGFDCGTKCTVQYFAKNPAPGDYHSYPDDYYVLEADANYPPYTFVSWTGCDYVDTLQANNGDAYRSFCYVNATADRTITVNWGTRGVA